MQRVDDLLELQTTDDRKLIIFAVGIPINTRSHVKQVEYLHRHIINAKILELVGAEKKLTRVIRKPFQI